MSHLIYLNMIQRIQTLFLITIPILLGIMQFSPLVVIEDSSALHSSVLFLWYNEDVYLLNQVMKDNIIVNDFELNILNNLNFKKKLNNLFDENEYL